MFRAKYRIQYLDKCQIKLREREKERLTKKRKREPLGWFREKICNKFYESLTWNYEFWLHSESPESDRRGEDSGGVDHPPLHHLNHHRHSQVSNQATPASKSQQHTPAINNHHGRRSITKQLQHHLSHQDDPPSGGLGKGCASRDPSCGCRKCSLISLGEVEPREVHTMIRFIKQTKVVNMN